MSIVIVILSVWLALGIILTVVTMPCRRGSNVKWWEPLPYSMAAVLLLLLVGPPILLIEGIKYLTRRTGT